MAKKMSKKSWAQKIDSAPAPHISVMDKSMWGMPVGTKLYISSPREVGDMMRTLAAGQSASLSDMRNLLAQKAGAGATCPMTTSIFARIVAEDGLERLQNGAKPEDIAPFWRWVDEKSPLSKKLSCGVDFIRHQRALEGLCA